MKQMRSTLLRYAVAVASAALATLLRLMLASTMGTQVRFVTYFIAVTVTAWYGGLGPALVTTALGAFATIYFVLTPSNSFSFSDKDDLLRFGLYLLTGTTIALFSEAMQRAQARAEKNALALSENRNLLSATLASIGDAVITTNAKGRVTYINRMAETLTGWAQKDALGEPLENVFNIVDEQTHEKAESLVTKVLKEGAAVGLAKHTKLIRKDGSEIPIDDSSAPIRDERGNVSGVVLIFSDITERRRSEDALAFASLIVKFSDDAIIGKTLDGTILSWNAGAEGLYGYTAEEMIGRSISILAEPDYDDMHQILEQLKIGKLIHHYETVRVKKNLELVNVSLTISPIIDSKGNITGASTIARDITERMRAEAERAGLLAREKAARVEAEEANRLKDEFLATVSHELRTPLNAILGWAHLLRARSFDEATTIRAVETIERNAKSQARIVEDILDVSRIITGKLRLDVLPVALAPVIESALDAVRPAAEAKDIRIQTILDLRAGPVSGDPNRLQQVVWNIASNAVKFTPRGGRVLVRLERMDSHIEITVSDTGQGIPAEFLPFIFDRFRQGDSTSTRAHGGLGLGLAIVRHLVEFHGGTIHADSPGKGSGATFTIRLPLMAFNSGASDLNRVPPSVSSMPPQYDAPQLNGIKVMVIDDEMDTREILKIMIEQYGAEVKTCASSAEALESLKR